MADTTPKRANTFELSVVMPVHNALPHLDEAIESILGQTFTNFEFVILDDASTDGSTERLRQWAGQDLRIRLLEVERNLGPAESSQRVAFAASAPIVARMDADDISYPERLREQLEVLKARPDAGLVASLSDIIDADGRMVRGPEGWRLSRKSVFVPFAHGAIMYRHQVFKRVGGYRRECDYWEDQDLVTRIGEVSKVIVIPRSLYQVRQSTTSTRVISGQEQLERGVDRAYRCIERLQQGADYEDLLSHPDDNRRLDPRVFISLGSVRLWAGGKPRLFRRLLRRGRLGFDTPTATALVWTAWASASPRSLRLFLRFLLRARNNLSKPRVNPAEPVVWTPEATLEPEGALTGKRASRSRAA